MKNELKHYEVNGALNKIDSFQFLTEMVDRKWSGKWNVERQVVPCSVHCISFSHSL